MVEDSGEFAASLFDFDDIVSQSSLDDMGEEAAEEFRAALAERQMVLVDAGCGEFMVAHEDHEEHEAENAMLAATHWNRG